MSADVQVFARFRPLNTREQKHYAQHPDQPCPNYTFQKDSANTIRVERPGGIGHEIKDFTFDAVFSEETTQAQLYERVAAPLVPEILKGYNCTLMAYGQTSAGKTHTVMGQRHNPEQQGIIPRLMKDLFNTATDRKDTTVFSIQCSYVEIYMEQVRDLINPKLGNLKLREVVSTKKIKSQKQKGRVKTVKKSYVYIEGCTVCTVTNFTDMMKVLKKGDQHRITAATEMNQRSSRSHSVFIVNVTQTNTAKQTRKSSKLFLVDLAGSEEVGRSGVTGLTLEQAKQINKSLSSLSHVIRALTDKKPYQHIPYRDSKLTRLLTDSLGGNSKTALILALSPSYDSLRETYSTLGFGARAKHVKNKARANEEMTVDNYKKMVQTLQHQVQHLEAKINEQNPKTVLQDNTQFKTLELKHKALKSELIELKVQHAQLVTEYQTLKDTYEKVKITAQGEKDWELTGEYLYEASRFFTETDDLFTNSESESDTMENHTQVRVMVEPGETHGEGEGEGEEEEKEKRSLLPLHYEDNDFETVQVVHHRRHRESDENTVSISVETLDTYDPDSVVEVTLADDVNVNPVSSLSVDEAGALTTMHHMIAEIESRTPSSDTSRLNVPDSDSGSDVGPVPSLLYSTGVSPMTPVTPVSSLTFDSIRSDVLEDLSMFQTGNLVVWGTDNLFTFEAF